MSRTLAIDPGEVRIGLAISDPSNTIARPLEILTHVSRHVDAKSILERAMDQDVRCIVVGVAYDQDGEEGPQARKALRLIDFLKTLTAIPIIAWDESGSTKAASHDGPQDKDLDARAAAVILQDYLDAQSD
jgi:putative Holliday junction resolvase